MYDCREQGKIEVCESPTALSQLSMHQTPQCVSKVSKGFQAGGIVGKDEWEEFKKLMGVGEGGKKKVDGKKEEKPTQKNTLANYFGKKEKGGKVEGA